jgi:HAD superfamily hydrolase (TIGR01459 family)
MSVNDETMAVRRISRLAEIADDYDVIFCDVWGVVHNGVAAFPPASEALVSFRRRGGTVVLITNAPRPQAPIRRQMLRLGVSPDAFDDVTTSGEVTVNMIAERIDQPVLHIGPPRDLSLFEAAGEMAGRPPLRVQLEEASYAVCTGLRDDRIETPSDYEPELRAVVARGFPMICANPDLVIHRGDALVYCAGSLAVRFEAVGGSVVYAGKPHPAIYRLALALAEKARGGPVDPRRVLAVGDNMKTDIVGAGRMGIDALFVTHGVHRDVLHGHSTGGPADVDALRRLYEAHSLWPIAAIPWLAG